MTSTALTVSLSVVTRVVHLHCAHDFLWLRWLAACSLAITGIFDGAGPTHTQIRPRGAFSVPQTADGRRIRSSSGLRKILEHRLERRQGTTRAPATSSLLPSRALLAGRAAPSAPRRVRRAAAARSTCRSIESAGCAPPPAAASSWRLDRDDGHSCHQHRMPAHARCRWSEVTGRAEGCVAHLRRPAR